MLRFPDVAFWAYTRSFDRSLNVVPLLRGLANLTLYLSVGAANYRSAQRVLAVHPDTLVSVLAPTVEAGEALYRSLTGRAAAPCPEKVGKLPLVTHVAKEPVSPAACAFQGRKGVVFPAIHGQLKPSRG